MREIISTPPKVPVFLCAQPTDMRLGLPGLEKKVRSEANRDPRKKGIYVFVSRDFSRIKLFFYDRNGFAMFYKMTPKRTFQVKWANGYRAITGVNLGLLLNGKAQKQLMGEKG